MLEECGLEYNAHAINIGKGEQFEPEFLKVSPNNRIPAITDSAGPGGELGKFHKLRQLWSDLICIHNRYLIRLFWKEQAVVG